MTPALCQTYCASATFVKTTQYDSWHLRVKTNILLNKCLQLSYFVNKTRCQMCVNSAANFVAPVAASQIHADGNCSQHVFSSMGFHRLKWGQKLAIKENASRWAGCFVPSDRHWSITLTVTTRTDKDFILFHWSCDSCVKKSVFNQIWKMPTRCRWVSGACAGTSPIGLGYIRNWTASHLQLVITHWWSSKSKLVKHNTWSHILAMTSESVNIWSRLRDELIKLFKFNKSL